MRRDLARDRGDSGRPGVVETHGEQGAENSPAIHGKRRKKIEQHQHGIDREQALRERAAGAAQRSERRPGIGHAQPRRQRTRDDDVHRRARQRHPQFLRRLVRHPFQVRDATDGQQGNVACLDAITPGHEGVAKLVQQHAQENRAEKRHATQPGHETATSDGVRACDQAEQQQESGVQINVDAKNSPQFETPFPGRPVFMAVPNRRRSFVCHSATT